MFKKAFIIIFVLSVIISISFISYSFIYFNKETEISGEKYFTISKGDSFKKTSNLLSKKGIIKYPYLFYYISRIREMDKISIKSGEYLFKGKISPSDVLNKLLEGRVYYRKLTFAEGLSTHSILEIINNAEGLVGNIPTDVKEGELLPETYLYTAGETRQDIIDRMRKDMKDFLDSEWEKRSKDIEGIIKTKEEALILASIVEKETGIPSERPDVASVFVNRLRIGMKVQSDPTLVYIFTKGDKSLEREIRKSDISRPSPYNTYLNYGLPPTPIANPGKESIKAVLNPAKTNYLYFVATGNGGHNFSSNYKDHRKFVKEYRENLKNNTDEKDLKNKNL